MGKKLINFELSQEQLEKEINRIQHRSRYRAALKSTVLMLLVLASVSVLAAALWFPVLQVTSESMTPQLENGHAVLTVRTQDIQQGDVVAFYHNNRVLIRRVIAVGGDWVHIDASGSVSVNGEGMEETYVKELVLQPNDLTYPYEVPDGCLFVMGDNRAESMDSRTSEIGCVSFDRIIGKVVFRIWPFDRLEYLG